MPTNAKYKIYSGSSWVEYHFTTNAAQVSQTKGTGFRKFVSANVKVNGVSFGEDSNDNATVTINGSHLNWYNGTKPTTNYLSSADTVQAAIAALDTAAKAAYDNVPSGILTTNDFVTNYPDLNSIEGLTGTIGFLKKTAANTWSLDTETYVPTSRTVGGHALSGDVTLYGADIVMTGTYNNVASYLMGLDDRISSTTQNYAIDITSVTGYKNNSLASNEPTVEISVEQHVTLKFLLLDGTTELAFSNLNIGDSIYITNEDYPDRWYAGTTGSGSSTKYIFKRLETTRLLWTNVASKPNSLSGYGIEDAKIENGVITLGSNTITPLTTHQDISGKADDNAVVHLTGNETISGTKTFGNTINASQGFNVGSINSIYPIVINSSSSGGKYVRLYPTTNNSSNFDIYLPAKAGTLATMSDVPTITVTSVGGEPPSSDMKVGDICIQVTA